MTLSLRKLFFLVILFVGIGSISHAQVQATNGSIQGDITDASGGLVPAANVEADEVDTNTAHKSVTDNSGHFEFPS